MWCRPGGEAGSIFRTLGVGRDGEVPGTAVRMWCWGREGVGGKRAEEGRVGGQGRRVKVGQAREGAGPAAGRDQVRGFGFSASGNGETRKG